MMILSYIFSLLEIWVDQFAIEHAGPQRSSGDRRYQPQQEDDFDFIVKWAPKNKIDTD